MGDEYRIENNEQLRELMGEASEATRAKVDAHLSEFARDFIARSPFLILATADAEGKQDASPKGDPPGFVHVEDEHTLLIPDRKGNKLLYGLENILANPKVGLIFLNPGTEETLRLNGHAELTRDPEVLAALDARGQAALLAIRVHVDECFFHCAKAFRRAALWKPDTWRPHKVSFGKIFAAKIGRGEDAEIAEKVDAAIEQNYREEM